MKPFHKGPSSRPGHRLAGPGSLSRRRRLSRKGAKLAFCFARVAAALLLGSSPLRVSARGQDRQHILRELSNIGSRLHFQSKLLSKDRKVTLDAAVSRDGIVSTTALIILLLATEQHQFSIESYCILVERQTRSAEPKYAWLMSSLYPHPTMAKALIKESALASYRDKNGYSNTLS